MEITVLKCDRCKKEVDGLIEFSFLNRNVELTEEVSPSHRPGLKMSDLMLGIKLNYPTVRGGLCLDCVKEFSRWLGHQENILSKG